MEEASKSPATEDRRVPVFHWNARELCEERSVNAPFNREGDAKRGRHFDSSFLPTDCAFFFLVDNYLQDELGS